MATARCRTSQRSTPRTGALRRVAVLRLADWGVSIALGLLQPIGIAKGQFQLRNEPVDLVDEARAAGMRAIGDHVGCPLGQTLPVGHPSPSPDIAEEEQREASQVVRSACMPKVGEQVFETKPEVLGKRFHGAMQHNILA